MTYSEISVGALDIGILICLCCSPDCISSHGKSVKMYQYRSILYVPVSVFLRKKVYFRSQILVCEYRPILERKSVPVYWNTMETITCREHLKHSRIMFSRNSFNTTVSVKISVPLFKTVIWYIRKISQ